VSLAHAGVVVGSTGSLIRFPFVVDRYQITLLSRARSPQSPAALAKVRVPVR